MSEFNDPRDIFSFTGPSATSVKMPSEPPSSRKSPRRSAQTDEEYFQSLKTKAMRGEDISKCDKSFLPRLVTTLRDDRDELISTGHFRESEAAHAAYIRTEQLLGEAEKLETQRDLLRMIDERIAEAKQDQRKTQDMIENQERNMAAAFDEEIEELKQTHERELEQLEKEWKSPEKQRRYNKASPQLKAMRLQQERLLNIREFEASRIVEKAADQLEAQEVDKNHANMEFDYQLMVKALLDKQADELKKLHDIHRVKKMAYQSAKNEEMRLHEQRIKKIELEREKAKNIAHVERLMKKYSANRTGIADERPETRSFRHAGKREIVVAEFNELSLPRLRNSARAKNATRRVMPRSSRTMY